MKRLSFLLVIALIGAVMVSCNKEGQFNPKKKISKISYSESYKYEIWNGLSWEVEEQDNSNYVAQRWNWNGNVLEGIDFYSSDGTLSYSEKYTYKGKQLSTISWGGAGRFELVYEKGKLSSIDYYSGSSLISSYVFTHDGNKISKITVNSYDAKATVEHPLPSWLLNVPARDFMKASRENSSYEYEFEWDGKNVKRMTYLAPGEREDYYYSYDNKLNPYYGFWEIDEFDVNSIMSKNNVTRLEYSYDGETHVNDYTYTYVGKYPASMTRTFNSSDDTYRYTSTETTFYDYE